MLKTKTILVVDDEPMLRDVLRIMLEAQGARVLEASDGLEGLEMFKKHKVDLVILDFSMPRMNGYQCYQELERVRAGVPVVLISGLTLTPGVEELTRAQKISYLAKPFSNLELLAAITKRLSGNSLG